MTFKFAAKLEDQLRMRPARERRAVKTLTKFGGLICCFLISKIKTLNAHFMLNANLRLHKSARVIFFRTKYRFTEDVHSAALRGISTSEKSRDL